MTISPFTPELASERRSALIRSADDYRLARAAQPVRASRLNLRVRPIRPKDQARLADLFDRLSPESRLARFLYPKVKLTANDLRYFTDVDHHDHEALIASTRFSREPVSVARFIRNPADPTSAEVAIAVVDAWQNRGAGSLLAVRLAKRAQQEGVSHFTAVTAADNVRARRLLMQLGDVRVVAREGAIVSYRVTLAGPALTSRRIPAAWAPAGAG